MYVSALLSAALFLSSSLVPFVTAVPSTTSHLERRITLDGQYVLSPFLPCTQIQINAGFETRAFLAAPFLRCLCMGGVVPTVNNAIGLKCFPCNDVLVQSIEPLTGICTCNNPLFHVGPQGDCSSTNPSARARRSVPQIALTNDSNQLRCPSGQTACFGGKQAKGWQWECVNLKEELTACGACGNDCTILPHVKNVGCSDLGRCQIFSCMPDYSLSNRTGECLPAHHKRHLARR